MIDPLDAIMGAFTCPATVTVVDKPFFKNRGYIVENEMVDNPVAEIGGENFAFYRFVYDKSNAPPGLVIPFKNVIAQMDEAAFVMKLKRQSIVGISLVPAGIVICQEKVVEKLIAGFS